MPHTLLLIFLLLALALGARGLDDRGCEYAQNTPPPLPDGRPAENYTRMCLPQWALNRTFSASTEAPIASALNTRAARVAPRLSAILRFIQKEADRAAYLRDNPPPTFEMPPEMFCNVEDDDSRSYSVNVSSSQYGFGLVTRKCDTDLFSKVEDTPFKHMKAFLVELDAVVPLAVRNAGVSFRRPQSYMLYNYTSAHDVCTIWHFTAFRRFGVWGLNTGITNDGLTANLPDYLRHYMVEVLHVVGGRVVPFPMLLRRPNATRYSDPEFKTPYVHEFVNSTTLLNSWGGTPATSLFETLYIPANNPGIKAAMDVGAATVEQIEDATTPSGMAILIAPIALTLLPLAVFTEMDTKATLVYTLATDILTVFPLAVKGFELIRYAYIRHDATRTRIYGGLGPNESAAMETWYADCKAASSVVLMGWLFLAMAIFFMVVGVALELTCKYALKGKALFRKKGIDDCECLEKAI